MNKKEIYKFRYGGKVDYIDLNTLLLSQIHFAAIINEFQKELYPDYKININIQAFKAGSFDVVYDFIEQSRNLITPENINITVRIIEGIVGLFVVKQFLKGKRADEETKEGQNVIIKFEGKQITVDSKMFQIYKSNNAISTAVEKNFQIINSDENIEDIEILKDDKQLQIIPKEKFGNLSNRNEYFSDEILEEIKEAMLTIIFETKTKFDMRFVYVGRKIDAYVSDSDFKKNIESGESFAQGDALLVQIKIYKQYERNILAYIDKKFEIVKVIRHIPRGEQKQLFSAL